MSVATPPLASETLADLGARIERLLGERTTAASWWVELVATLDAMAARLSQFSADAGARLAFVEQIRLDAPHLFDTARGLDEESDAVEQEIVSVRLAAGDAAGDPSRVWRVRSDVSRVMARLRRLEHRSNSLVFDAYDRDIGGE
jgi:hypothetical protein